MSQFSYCHAAIFRAYIPTIARKTAARRATATEIRYYMESQ